MGATQVAEGPLIKHVPGGYAEWRAKESGLPPARLHSSEGEWWGKLVGPTDTTTPDPILGVGDSGVGEVGKGFTDDEKQGLDDPSFDTTLREELNKEQTPDPKPNSSVQPYEWKTDYTPVDWDVNYNEVPQGYGWGVSTDSPILPYQGGSRVGGGISGGGPSSRGAVVPGGQGDRLTTRGSAGLQKPLVDFKPSPTEYVKGYDPAKTFIEKPGAIKDLKDVATDGLKLGERMVRSLAGPTAADFKPRNPKEAALHNKFKKGYEIFVAAIKEGGGVFGGTLYETGGGRTTTPDTKTGEVPEAHFPNVLKTLRKVFAGEKDPIVMQDYGDLHWATIIATISLANTYGPIVWAIPGLRTMADTIGASMNGMLMDKPNLEGNPVQDTMHRLFWIAGQAGQKVYENSVGKIIEKLRGTPKSEKTRGTISEELDDLVNIKDAFKGHENKRIKVSGRVEAGGSKHLQPHDPLDVGTTTQKPGEQITAQVTGQQPAQPIGTTAQPVRVPTQRPSAPEPSGVTQLDPKSITGPEQLPAKTIDGPLGEFPQGTAFPGEPLPGFEKPSGPIDEARIEELADEIMGQAPTGDEPFVIKGDYTPKPRVETEVETRPEVREPPKLDLPELDPETLKELDIKPAEDPVDPYATVKGDTAISGDDEKGKGLNQPLHLWLPVDSFGNQYGESEFDPNDIVGIEYRTHWSKEGEQDEFEREANRLGDQWTATQEAGQPDPTGVGQADPQDFRSDQQKELGLTVGNQWVNEFDRSTWPAIKATQTPHLNPKGGADLWYNKMLPSSNLEDHPQYYGNNPESHLNVEPDVNVEIIPQGGKEEIFNWSSQAGLNPTIFKPIYNNDYQFIGNEMFTLETESYPKGDGWGYRYRYNSAESGERGQWHEWTPGP